MKLQEKLDQMRNEFEGSAPPEALAVMHKATEDLKNSGTIDLALKKGDTIPQFSLPDQSGKKISSGSLLKKGALIVNFYRGVW